MAESVVEIVKKHLTREVLCAFVLFLGISGCDSPPPKFAPNRLFIERMARGEGADLEVAAPDIAQALEDWFGTPDQPKWPQILQTEEFAGLVDVDRLGRAAGQVRSDENDVHYGLYREHCVNCHSQEGNGRGPTSVFLNPYPRDFRPGIYKFKATAIGRKPTRADLRRTLVNGIVGTSMPSFQLLKSDDIEALLDYLVYLSVRGEVERALIAEAAFELDAGDRFYAPELSDRDPDRFAEQREVIEDVILEVAGDWQDSFVEETVAPEPPEGVPAFAVDSSGRIEDAALRASIDRGREIYLGEVANCASCHGKTGVGDGPTKDYDFWTKEWTTSLGLDPADRDAIEPLLDLGALKPRVISPRDLRAGIYRGGGQPSDIYSRIVNGIEGSPMPAVAMQPDNPRGLTELEVWDLVNYVLSLPHEQLELLSGASE
ncbi:MAG TPA: cytochrome C [Planctomycetaceae bacterium]|nr:cytochrome C [Planctomycetaceae bacterium]